MVSYSTNWMGPISMGWYDRNGIPRKEDGQPVTYYCAGRIDVYGTGAMFNEELSLPPMEAESWNLFSRWLEDFESEEMMTLDELEQEYVAQTGDVIKWFEEVE